MRIDASAAPHEVSLDDGPWIAAAGPALVPGALGGVTLGARPGAHRLRWRRAPTGDGRRFADGEAEVVVPEDGDVAVELHRWPWGIPTLPRRAHDAAP